MNIENKRIAICCCYEAPYGGNFIKMITALAEFLIQQHLCKVFFVFPMQTKKKWLEELSKEYTIGYTPQPYKNSSAALLYYFNLWNIDLVYTHFENYDIPVAKAIKKTHRNIKMVWHIHDYMSLDKTGLNFKLIRKIGTNLKLWIHYGWYGRNAYFIGVSPEVTNFVSHYRTHFFSFPPTLSNEELKQKKFPYATVLLNGISMDRLQGIYKRPEGMFTFLAYGGESYSKGIPCLFDAAEILHKKNIPFKIILTKGYTTQALLDEKFQNQLPEWLITSEQTEEIISLFNQAHAFISPSLRETMSMGIAEASIYGLPVIQSDIPGTYWNTDTPSTFLFRVNDTQDLARQMEEVILFNQKELADKCHHSSLINRNRLSMSKWCHTVIEIFKELR